MLKKDDAMTRRRVGLWLVGAFGGVGTTITLGLSALAKGLMPSTGLVTALPMFEGLALPDLSEIIVGGHEIRETSFEASAEEFRKSSGVIDAPVQDPCRAELAAAAPPVRPGTKLNAGPAIGKLGIWGDDRPDRTIKATVDRLAADMAAFVQAEKIDHLIVLSVASTEPLFELGDVHQTWKALSAALNAGTADLLPASSLYALAAFQGGHTYLNFTPSLGATVPALHELAETTGALYGGKDGKTGETLMKTVLAPMFVHRNLHVMSWVGHNIFGNRDGIILDDPKNKASKVDTKDRVVNQVLGYKPSTLVTIEYIPDMGDWKAAWDHIHFQGFLGSKMTLQFTWQGCDSLLAAPLGIDLCRLADFEKQRGGKGLMRHLSSFFKGPEGVDENDFFEQFRVLQEYVAKARR
jgi:myo-inositol-1-phosphate synthase